MLILDSIKTREILFSLFHGFKYREFSNKFVANNSVFDDRSDAVKFPTG